MIDVPKGRPSSNYALFLIRTTLHRKDAEDAERTQRLCAVSAFAAPRR
jgi:hypothetical protein